MAAGTEGTEAKGQGTLNPDQQLVHTLRDCRNALAEGLETPGILEPEWSVADRVLVQRIDLVLESLLTRAKVLYGEEKAAELFK